MEDAHGDSSREPDGDSERPTRRGAEDEPTRRFDADEEPPRSLSPDAGLTPLQTLLSEEIDRTRVFMRIAIALSFAVALSTPFLDGDPLARAILLVALGLTVAACSWLSWKIRDERGYDERSAAITSLACTLGAFGGIYYFGVFSPAPVVIPFGLFFFSLSQSYRTTLAVLVVVSAGYALLVIGMAAGLLLDRGIVSGQALPVADRIVMAALIETIVVATYLIGRASRRANLAAVERHDRAARRLAQREALLREARQDLELALQAGGMGRYTDVVLGSFQLGTVLGRGGMGEVYEATKLDTGEPAAVKVLQRHLMGDPENVRRFLREAQIVKQLDMVHVVRVLEIGGLDALTPFIAMERLRGDDLAELLRHRRQLSMQATLGLVREVGRGLEAAHAAGIVHRDIKPRNLFLAEIDGARVWKILDFGISKLAHQSGTLTRGDLLGTPAYMAPEQATGGEATPLSDLYSLGVICYRALTGRPAFSGVALPDTVYKVVHSMPPRPSATSPSLPPGIDDVLAVALAKDPSQRFQSVDELVAALEIVERGRFHPRLRERARAIIADHPWGDDDGPREHMNAGRKTTP